MSIFYRRSRGYDILLLGREFSLTYIYGRRITRLAQNALKYKRHDADKEGNTNGKSTNHGNRRVEVRANPLEERCALIFRATHCCRFIDGWEPEDLLRSLEVLRKKDLIRYKSRNL